MLQISQTATKSNICSKKEKSKSSFSLESQYFMENWDAEKCISQIQLISPLFFVYFIWIAMKANLDPNSVLSFSFFFMN